MQREYVHTHKNATDTTSNDCSRAELPAAVWFHCGIGVVCRQLTGDSVKGTPVHASLNIGGIEVVWRLPTGGTLKYLATCRVGVHDRHLIIVYRQYSLSEHGRLGVLVVIAGVICNRQREPGRVVIYLYVLF